MATTLAGSFSNPSPKKVPETVFCLVQGYDALPPEEAERVAQRLCVLYAWFLQEFGGLHGFKQRPAIERLSYLWKLEDAAARSKVLAGTASGEAFYALSMLSYYIVSHLKDMVSPDARTLAERMVSAIVSQKGGYAASLLARTKRSRREGDVPQDERFDRKADQYEARARKAATPRPPQH